MLICFYKGVYMQEKVIKIKRVKEITSLSTASIYRLMSVGHFPRQIKLSERSCGWLESEIKSFLDRCKKDRD